MLLCGLGLQYRFDIFLWLLLFPSVLAGSYRYGQWEEKTVAGALAVDLLISHLVGFYDTGVSRLGVLATDVTFLGILGLVAVRGRRWWPSWATAFQLMIVVVHLVFAARGGAIEGRAYLIAVVIWTWLVLISLGFGVWDRVLEAARTRGGVWPSAAIFVLALGFSLWEIAAVRGLKPPFLE